MTLLLRDPDARQGEQAPEAPPTETAPEVRSCPSCHTPLAEGQDWCLACGQAQPGRLAALPGRRAAATVLTLTALLVGGAVAASYAALQSDDPAPAPTPVQLAQVPSTATPPAAAPVAPAAPPSSTATPPAPAPGSSTSALPPATPESTPPAPSAPVTPAGTGSTGTGSTGSPTGSSGTGTGSTGTTTGSSGTKADTRTSTTPEPPAPVAIKLADGAAAPYDPYTRNIAVGGDIAKVIDGDPNTSFPITVADGATTIGSGIVVDLAKLRGIRELDLTTKTPGFKLELYATDSEELPPDVLDTRWAHLKDVTDVGAADGAAGRQSIDLGSGSTKYRRVLLWFTAPPADGLTVRISELKLLG
ncbi:hypothetical protein [Baekduia soli]|uniref:hypothetical protein n=1 Tax=Baekduia soli TaxID=496014 RepID=UPI00165253F0|nr:hypothetical protein [Baekduia soli]